MINVQEKRDEKLIRKQVLASFFSSDGYREFREELENHIVGVDTELTDEKRQYVSASNLDRLNFNLGVKSGLRRVLNILAGFEEELAE